jgi:hypothetical protein
MGGIVPLTSGREGPVVPPPDTFGIVGLGIPAPDEPLQPKIVGIPRMKEKGSLKGGSPTLTSKWSLDSIEGMLKLIK